MKICKYCHKVIKEEDIKAENQKYHKGECRKKVSRINSQKTL